MSANLLTAHVVTEPNDCVGAPAMEHRAVCGTCTNVV